MDEQDSAEIYGLSDEASDDDQVLKKDWHRGEEIVDIGGQTGRVVGYLK